MLEGLLYLIPDIEARFGHDACFRFHSQRYMMVYADANGSLRHTSRNEPVKLQCKWFMVDEPQPYEPLGNTASEESFEKAQHWIRECLANHKLCGTDGPSALPTRILDLGKAPENEAGGGEPDVQLLESSGQSARYISLSHSWGGEQPLTTTTATVEKHKAGIPLASLPRTFQDAVHIARRFGIRYLWIDSLCIIQDSAEDWQQEASRMASIYRNSWLTVYATASSSPSSGIFRNKQAVWIQADDPEDETLDDLFPEAAKLRQDLRLSLRFATTHPDLGQWAEPERQQSALPLMTRAWAYQERLLSPRVLHFGPQEVFWECMQDLDCECGGMKWRSRHMGSYANRDTAGELPPKVSHYAALHVGAAAQTSKIKAEKRRKKLLSRWEEMVGEYTRRSLTFPADRLPAFSGVAGEMVAALGMRYRAGQWEETLPAALLYERSNCTKLARLTMDDARPAPSWSWASVDGPVRFLIPLGGRPEWANSTEFAQVLELRCVPSGSDDRGRVDAKESYMMLSAELVEASMFFVPDPHAMPYKAWMRVKDAISKGVEGPPENGLGKGSFMIRVGKAEPLAFVPDVRLCDEDGNWIWEADDELSCAKIMESQECFYWLVLRRSPQDNTAYERIGVIEHPDADWKSKHGKKSLKVL